MNCLNCNKKVPYEGGYCSWCGHDLFTGKRLRKLIHPKRATVSLRITTLLISFIALLMVLHPWLKNGDNSYYAHKFVDFDRYDEIPLKIFWGFLGMTVMQAVVIISELCHIIIDLTSRNTSDKNTHIKLGKIFSDIALIASIVYIVAFFALIPYEGVLKLSIMAYIVPLLIAFSRYFIITEYFDAYNCNIRMYELDKKRD